MHPSQYCATTFSKRILESICVFLKQLLNYKGVRTYNSFSLSKKNIIYILVLKLCVLDCTECVKMENATHKQELLHAFLTWHPFAAPLSPFGRWWLLLANAICTTCLWPFNECWHLACTSHIPSSGELWTGSRTTTLYGCNNAVQRVRPTKWNATKPNEPGKPWEKPPEKPICCWAALDRRMGVFFLVF